MKEQILKIAIVAIAIALAFVFGVISGSCNVQTAHAETLREMRLRIINDYIAKYDVDKNCDAECVAVRLHDAPYLAPLAKQIGFDTATTVRASIGHSIDWGFNFEHVKAANTDCRAKSTLTDNKCAPTMDDWIYAWTSIGEDFRYKLAATPELWKVDRWAESRYARLSLEYGGSQ